MTPPARPYPVAALRFDIGQAIVDAAYPTSGTEGPNAWTDERIRVRTLFARELEHILAGYVLVSADMLAEALRDTGLKSHSGGRPFTETEVGRAILAALKGPAR